MGSRPSLTIVLAVLIVILIVITSILTYAVFMLNMRYSSLEGKLGSEIKAFKGSIKDVYDKLSSLLNTLKNLNNSLSTTSRKTSEKIKELFNELLKLRSKLQEINSSLSTYVTLNELRALSTRITKLESTISNLASASDVEKLRSILSNVTREVSKIASLLEFPIQIVDATGKAVVIPSKPTRIVSLLPSTTEILFAVGAGNQVVGVDQYSNYPPEVVKAVKMSSV